MMLTIALSKGRLADSAAKILKQCGLNTDVLFEDSRKLVFCDEVNSVRFILVKPTDVPVYVDHGIADMGIVGKDTLLEAGLPLYEMVDLRMAKCKMSVAGLVGAQEQRGEITSNIKRVATKYPRMAKMFYNGSSDPIAILAPGLIS